MGDSLENRSKEIEEKNAQTFTNLKEDIAQVETCVTNKLLKEIEPSLNLMKEEIQTSVGSDIRRLVQEEMALQKMKENKVIEDAINENGDPEITKNDKIQKNNKTTKPKKNEVE